MEAEIEIEAIFNAIQVGRSEVRRNIEWSALAAFSLGSEGPADTRGQSNARRGEFPNPRRRDDGVEARGRSQSRWHQSAPSHA